MAYPVILVKDGTGSDSAASGAGPSTALTGTGAATDSGGTTVTLDAGTNLTGVATDGSHAIWIDDTTSGHRNWAKITGSAGSGGATPTVTVNEAFTGSLSGKTWAIGGKRASLDGSLRLLYNAGDGDAMPGWTVQFMSGHTETATQNWRISRSGDATDGPITVRGEAGGTRPIITWNADVHGFDIWNTPGKILRFLDLRNSASNTKYAVFDQGSVSLLLDLKIDDSTDQWSYGIAGTCYASVIGCEIAYVDNDGYHLSDGSRSTPPLLLGNYIHDCGNHGIATSNSVNCGMRVVNNILSKNIGNGLYHDIFDTVIVEGNVFYGNFGDGIGWHHFFNIGSIINNLFVSNHQYGINFNGTLQAIAFATFLRSNGFYNNTSGKYNVDVATLDVGEVVFAGAPFTNAAGEDFTLNDTDGAPGRAAAYPPSWSGSSTTNYRDIGAAQHQDGGGSGGGGLRPVGVGGLVG